MPGSREVGDRLDQAIRDSECVADDVLAVAGHRAPCDLQSRVFTVEAFEDAPYDRHRIAAVALVGGVDDDSFPIDEDGLDCSRTCIDAKIVRPAVRDHGTGGYGRTPMAFAKFSVRRFVGEQRGYGDHGDDARRLAQLGDSLGKIRDGGRTVCRSQGYVEERVFRTEACGLQALVECLAQLAHERKRSAEIDDLSPYGTSLCKPRDRLVHHRMEDACGDVALASPLVQQRLYIRLREHAAPGCDRVDFLCIGSLPVHLIGRNLQKGCHLVDECSGSACTGTVHPHLHPMREEEYLRILPTEFDDHIGIGYEPPGGDACGVDFLDEGKGEPVGHAHACRAADHQLGALAFEDLAPDVCSSKRADWLVIWERCRSYWETRCVLGRRGPHT